MGLGCLHPRTWWLPGLELSEQRTFEEKDKLFRFAIEMLGSGETEAGARKLLQARTGKVSK